MGTKGEDSPRAVHAASSVCARGSSFDIQASMPETYAMEHLLGTGLGAKGWEYREPEERGLGTVGSNSSCDGELGEAPGSAKEKAAVREGVDFGQVETAGNSIPGQERRWQSPEVWQGQHCLEREPLLVLRVCWVGWARVSCPGCWAQDCGLEDGSPVPGMP